MSAPGTLAPSTYFSSGEQGRKLDLWSILGQGHLAVDVYKGSLLGQTALCCELCCLASPLCYYQRVTCVRSKGTWKLLNMTFCHTGMFLATQKVKRYNNHFSIPHFLLWIKFVLLEPSSLL